MTNLETVWVLISWLNWTCTLEFAVSFTEHKCTEAVSENGLQILFCIRWWPAMCDCPGGNSSWTRVKHDFPPEKHINNTYCYGQIDLCQQNNGKMSENKFAMLKFGWTVGSLPCFFRGILQDFKSEKEKLVLGASAAEWLCGVMCVSSSQLLLQNTHPPTPTVRSSNRHTPTTAVTFRQGECQFSCTSNGDICIPTTAIYLNGVPVDKSAA